MDVHLLVVIARMVSMVAMAVAYKRCTSMPCPVRIITTEPLLVNLVPTSGSNAMMGHDGIASLEHFPSKH